MSFINVPISQRHEGEPGIVEPERFNIVLNTNNIVLFHDFGKEGETTFVRLPCGATLTVMMSKEDFEDLLIDKVGEEII
jgi:hypothetical protein